MVTGARFLVGDVHERMAELEDGRYDLVICSPPFLALRSYLPDGHPLKHLEIGSEATPAAFLDVMLALTAEWGRLLAPHGSLAVEIGDTYSGSGGGGGDYYDGGPKAGQPGFTGSAAASRDDLRGANARHWREKNADRDAWPLAKSLAMIPELYAASLAYGRNLLTGEPSPAGRWRVRNFKPWIRSNPPVGALGDKERPATSYVTVATRATNRYFDLDAVRTAPLPHTVKYDRSAAHYANDGYAVADRDDGGRITSNGGNQAGAPPLDWFHQADAIIDAEIDRRAKEGPRHATRPLDEKRRAAGDSRMDGGTPYDAPNPGARGVHIRRALERGGILRTLDALDVSPKGYKGAHYAVWPMELVKLLLSEMTPRRVCTTCGEPSRRITETIHEGTTTRRNAAKASTAVADGVSSGHHAHRETDPVTTVTTTGWSDCGHGTWRPGRILDPFAGSGTTLAVATGLGMDADGIDLDQRNAMLALERVGMWLHIVWPDPDWSLTALPSGVGDYRPWITDQQAEHIITALVAALHTGTTRADVIALPTRRHGKSGTPIDGQGDLFADDLQLTVDYYPEALAR